MKSSEALQYCCRWGIDQLECQQKVLSLMVERLVKYELTTSKRRLVYMVERVSSSGCFVAMIVIENNDNNSGKSSFNNFYCNGRKKNKPCLLIIV